LKIIPATLVIFRGAAASSFSPLNRTVPAAASPAPKVPGAMSRYSISLPVSFVPYFL
jgi:hypothetical protein